MQKSSPVYRINYLFCKQKHHSDEKANMICLSKQCQQNSLICSFCLQEKHKGHSTKPLKHFLSELEKQYSQQQHNKVDAQLEQLQSGKLFLLTKIKEAVQNLASRFMQLEQEVTQRYEAIKSQILQKASKRNRFSSFYQSMAVQGKGDPNFQIQNYLYFQPLYSFNLSNDFDKFISDSNKSLELIKNNLIEKRKDNFSGAINQTVPRIKQLELQNNNTFIIPQTIKRVENIFTQQNPTTKQTLGYLNVVLKDLTAKIRIKVVSLPATAKLTLGLGKYQEIKALNHKYPPNNIDNYMYVNSVGQCKKHNYNYITGIKTGDVLDVLVKKNNCKISIKNNICCFNLNSPSDKQSLVLFFSMQGVCQIEMIYPYVKS